MIREPINIVLTSGPVGGKTEIIRYAPHVLIDAGYQPFLVHEIATELEKTGIHPKHLTGLPGFAFQQVVAATYMNHWYQVYERIENLQASGFMKGVPVIIHDRGFFDQRVYCDSEEEFQLLRKTFLPLEWEKKFGLVVHMQSLAVDKPELYEKLRKDNPARPAHEGASYAKNMDEGFVKAWSQVPHCQIVTIQNNGDANQKYRNAVDVVLEHLKQVA